MKPLTLSHVFKRTARRLGLGEFRFHDLRHTHASLLLSVGTPPHVVQSRLGHQTSQITLDIYGHVLPQSDVDAGATIDHRGSDRCGQTEKESSSEKLI